MNVLDVNGRDYRVSGEPVVVICVDGSEPAYHEAAVREGAMPWLADVVVTKTSWPARCAMPALTNPNNLSIATGVSPAAHGISGNWYLDTGTGEEVLMDDPALVRVPTILAEARRAGIDVAVVTAKDKLRRMLGAGLDEDTCCSAERAPTELLEALDMERPPVYSPALSEVTLAAGVHLMRTRRPALMYLSLSDYVQHKHAPGTPEATAFYAMLDRYAAQLDALGAVVALTADHGMSAKPRVLYLEDALAGTTADLRVVLPITDPYVAHHGALGSFASLYTSGAPSVADAARALPGVELVLSRDEAARQLDLPGDRIGDLVVLAEAGTALGRTPAAHDLSGLDAPLRSHGGLGEADVPLLVNRQLTHPGGVVHNYDAFWLATTGTA